MCVCVCVCVCAVNSELGEEIMFKIYIMQNKSLYCNIRLTDNVRYKYVQDKYYVHHVSRHYKITV